VAFYVPSSSTSFQHQDWLGTERLRTTYNGGVEGTYTSLPFGDAQTTVAPGTDLDPYHYASLDYDSETSTDHAQFRQYNSTQGHWMSPDPYSGSYDFSNPQSMNRYVYALSNPLSAVDPSGLNFCVPGGRGSTSQYCQSPNFGDGDGTANQLLTILDSIYGGPTSFTYTNSQGNLIQYNLGTDEDGDSVWIGSNGDEFAVNSETGAEIGAPVVMMTFDLAITQSTYLVAGNNAPNNGGLFAPAGKICRFGCKNVPPPTTCKDLDTEGDIVGGIGAAGTVGSGAVTLATWGTTSPGTLITGTASGILWAYGNLLNLAAKHGIGCTGTL